MWLAAVAVTVTVFHPIPCFRTGSAGSGAQG